MNPGIHLFHKPTGPTSFSVVQTCHELSRQQASAKPGRKPLTLCHGGTLDPFASGLLLILVEPATRLFDHLHAIPKTYIATVRWGRETDNGDPLGKTVGQPGTPEALAALTPQRLDEALTPFIGWHDQVPPATSNKRIEGERAYTRAHRGEDVQLPPSRVYLHQAQWLSHDLPYQSTLKLTTRGGYYVRALIRDLGRALNVGAHLSALCRTQIGPWQDPGPDAPPVHVPPDELLCWAPTRPLSDQDMGDLRQGQSIGTARTLPPAWQLPEGFPDPQSPVRATHQGKLVALLKVDDEGRYRLLSSLRPGF